MELFVAATREAVLMADCKKSFSQENFMLCSLSMADVFQAYILVVEKNKVSIF